MTTRALDELARRLTVTRWRGATADARCPAHPDERASLTFGPADNGGVVVHCHAGCTTENVVHAIGLTMKDLSPDPHVVAEYRYLTEDGVELYRVQRWEPKDFRCVPGLPAKAQRVLFHSEMLPQARATGARVWVCEGEKDALTLLSWGEIAVCGAGGAGSWLDHYADQLAGLDVLVVADNDDPGKAHARAVAASVDGRAKSVALVAPSYGKDITDQLDAGYDPDTVIPLPATDALGVHRADQVRETQIAWLWPGYLPLGKLVMLDGDPGDGKSVMTCDFAARLSTGAPMPDGVKSPVGPVEVVMISAEDDPQDTIRPRLRVAGANLTRVHLVVEGSIDGHPFSLGRDIDALEDFVTQHNVRLIVIDPLMSFMPEGVDPHRDAEVRRALHPLVRMAARTSCTVLVVRHMTKGRTKAIYAGGGSIAFIGAARVGFLVGNHPHDETRRVLACVKINVGRMPPALGYQVVSSANEEHVPVLAWDPEPLDATAQELLDGEDAVDERDSRDMARDFLVDLLSVNHSGLSWTDIVKAGKREDHSEATLRRVRKHVARLVRNPLGADGHLRKGAFWVHINQKLPTAAMFTDSDEVEQDAQLAPLSNGEQLPVSVTESDLPGPGPCDVCGASPAVVFAGPPPVRRCLSHHPSVYGGS